MDYGTHSIGTDTDAELWIYDADGTTVLAQDGNTVATAGAGGSISSVDPLVTFVAQVAGVYYIRVVAEGGGSIATGATYILNVSLSGQPVTGETPFVGNDSADGGVGDDVLYGGAGNDYLEGADDDDLIDGGSGNDRTFGGSGNDTVQGGSGADTVYGGLGEDSLNGGDGNDLINGGVGADIINSGLGDDILWETDPATADTWIGGGGLDTYDVSTLQGGFVINLASGTAVTGGVTDSLSGIANAYGSIAADLITGDTQSNILHGHVGADTLDGGLGEDTLYGGDGIDRLKGGLGNDTLEGGLGNDFYWVNSAVDLVRGEAGFATGGGIDTVWAAVSATLASNVEILRLMESGAIDATGNDAPNTLVGNLVNNVLEGRGGNDQINGNGGNDTLIGGEGVDTLVGGAGADTFVYAAVSNSRSAIANRDVLNGFDRGAVQDRIDLSAIDANTGTALNDAFSFIGSAAFTAAGQVRILGLGGPNAVIVEVNVNSALGADMQIFVNLQTTMAVGDFVL